MMFARLLRIAFAAAFVIAVSSCEERPDEELSNGIDFMYCPRDCEYVHVNAFSESDAAPYVEGDLPLIWGLSDAGRAIPADDLCLRVDVGSYTEEMLEESGLDPHWNFLSTHDGQMEDQMTRYLFLSFTDVYDGTLPVFVEYRKEVCREIEIMADMNLFGRAPGEDLSDKFEFALMTDPNFLFSSDKRLIGLIENGMGVEEYLAFEPIVFPTAFFKAKETPAEAPAECTLTVVLELEGGKSLSATTELKLGE